MSSVRRRPHRPMGPEALREALRATETAREVTGVLLGRPLALGLPHARVRAGPTGRGTEVGERAEGEA